MIPFEARPAKGKLVLMLIGAMVMIAGAIFILTVPDYVRPLVRIAAMIGIPFFGVAAAVLFRMLLSGKVQVRIDGRGICWSRWSETPIPFEAIRSAWTMRVLTNEFLCLELHDPDRYATNNRLLRMSAASNRGMGCGDIPIGMSGLDRSFGDLEAAFDAWARQRGIDLRRKG